MIRIDSRSFRRGIGHRLPRLYRHRGEATVTFSASSTTAVDLEVVRRAGRSASRRPAAPRSPSGAFCFSSTSTIVRWMRPDSSSGRTSASISGVGDLVGIARGQAVDRGEPRRSRRSRRGTATRRETTSSSVASFHSLNQLDQVDAAVGHAHVARRLAREELVDDLERPCRGRRCARARAAGTPAGRRSSCSDDRRERRRRPSRPGRRRPSSSPARPRRPSCS